jgi:hypothetical protein
MIAASGNKLAPSFYVIVTGIISIAAVVPLAFGRASVAVTSAVAPRR